MAKPNSAEMGVRASRANQFELKRPATPTTHGRAEMGSGVIIKPKQEDKTPTKGVPKPKEEN